MSKPSIGGFYTLSNGTKGRIMQIELVKGRYTIGHTSFSGWFKEYNEYKITVAYELPNGRITSEDVYVRKQ